MGMSITLESLRGRVEGVRQLVEFSAERVGRNPAAITIVAVSKTVDRDTMMAAYDLGLRNFGENRVPDARQKLADPMPPDTTLHLIGQLQTNKANHAVDLFDVIESVDRSSLIAELEKQAAKRGITLPVLLQVNVAREEQKAGAAPEEVGSLVNEITWATHLSLIGLMTMAPLVADPEDVRPVFRKLREMRDHLQSDAGLKLPVLSMGMTNDYMVAIEEGATEVRVGRAIFG
jgi:pyridoxal phosphate enzyme (YggS family)